MRLQQNIWLLLWCGAALICCLEARRIRVQPLPQEQEQEEETIQYYSAEPREDSQQGVVYVASADQYNGLYGQPTASPRSSHDNYIQSARISASHAKQARVKEQTKAPPVQTIRNYNKVNDDGSFTFGYEAADGSFKEETRGTDCVVRGKYGYVDPDGNKREFTYVSGNPCDPNAPKEEEVQEEESNEPENVPANYPTKPIRPLRPITSSPKPAITLFQNNYHQDEDVQPEPEQLLKTQSLPSFPVRQQYIPRPQLYQDTQNDPEEELENFQRARYVPSTTPSSVVYKQSVTPVNITPRPITTTTARTELPATTYRPQLLQVAVTPRPSLLYTKQVSATPRPSILSPTASPVPISVTSGGLDFESEFQRFQHDNNIVSPSPRPISIPKPTPKSIKPSPSDGSSSGQVYSSELIFDPVSGLYNTQLYQTLPQTDGDFSLSHRIQPYVHQPQYSNIQQLQQQSALYRRPTQQLYQQQQSDLQFQNSAQLFAQQQQQQQRARAHAQTQQSREQPQSQRTHPQPQPQQQQQQQYYYIQPTSYQHPQALVGGGQIDAFLRGQNIQF